MLLISEETRQNVEHLKSALSISIEFIDAILQDKIYLVKDKIYYLPQHAESALSLLHGVEDTMKEIKDDIDNADLLSVYVIFFSYGEEFAREHFSTPAAAREHVKYLRRMYGDNYMRGKGEHISYLFERERS